MKTKKRTAAKKKKVESRFLLSRAVTKLLAFKEALAVLNRRYGGRGPNGHYYAVGMNRRIVRKIAREQARAAVRSTALPQTA